MTYTFRIIILALALVLTTTAGLALGAGQSGDSPRAAARPTTRQAEEARRAPADQAPEQLGQAGIELPELTSRFDQSREHCGPAGPEPAGIVHDLDHRVRILDVMETEIAEIEALGVRIATWPGTDNDPLLDRLVAQRYEAMLALVGGDSDLARRTLGHVSSGLGVVEAVERSQEERFGGRVDDAG